MVAHIPTVTVAGIDPDVLTVAVAVLAGGLGTLVLAIVLADRRGLLPTSNVPFRRWISVVVGGLSLGAGSIHVAVIDVHFAEFPPFGFAFVVLAGFQFVWAVAYLLSPERPVATSAIVVNGGALLVWAVSRTVGLPFGPEPGLIEPVGPLDVAAGLMEVALIAVLAWDLGAIGRRVRPALPRARAAVVLGSTTLAVALLTTTAFAAASGDPHGGLGHHEAQPVAAAASPSPTTSGATPTTGSARPSDLAVLIPASPAPSSSSSTTPSAAAPSTVAPPAVEPSASVSPTRSPGATPGRMTPAPPTPKPPTPRPPPSTRPGQITFGTSIDQDGEIAVPIDRFGEGQHVFWVAVFTEAPNASTIRFLIVQILADGREFEHWREDVPVADPAAHRLAGNATMSIYLHGGEGNYRMRYKRGDTLLAEGAFEFAP